MFEAIGEFFRELVRAQMAGEGFWYLLGYYLVIMLLERLLYLFQHRHDWNECDARANLWNGIFTALVNAVVGAVIFVTIYSLLFENLRLTTFPLTVWAFALAWAANDLAYYLDHRIAHRTGLFWAVHHTHHSSNEFNILVAQRGNIFSLGGLGQPVYFLLAILGIPLAMLVTVQFFGNLWGIFNHTRLVDKMGPLEEVLATPANHRVHHGANPQYLDKNYGQTLIVWDRLFGTFEPEREEPRFGLVTPMNSMKLWDIQTSGVRWLWGQMKRADRWQDKLRYLWKPPGWSHDGCHETSEIMQERAGLVAQPARREDELQPQ